MSHRRIGQLSLADGLVARQASSNAVLERILALIDWRAVEQVLVGLHGDRRGAPSYPPLVMLKAVLLQQWYGLSDPALEAALADRLSFRRFCGLALAEATPDHSTIHRFRNALRVKGLDENLFAEIDRQGSSRAESADSPGACGSRGASRLGSGRDARAASGTVCVAAAPTMRMLVVAVSCRVSK